MSGRVQWKVAIVAAAIAYVTVFATTGNAGENAWTTAGPYGGWIRDVVFDPLNPSIAYARGQSALYKSTDGGRTWADLGFDGGGWLYDIAVETNSAGRLYAVGSGGAFRSSDGGATFQLLPVPSTNPTLFGAVSPASVTVSRSGATVHIEMSDTSAYVSTDAGATFTARPQGGPYGKPVIHPSNESLFYGLRPADLRMSADGGSSWAVLSSLDTSNFQLALTTDPVETLWRVENPFIVGSTDSGSTWIPRLTIDRPWLSQDANAPGVLHAGSAETAGLVYRYANGNWQQLAGTLPGPGHNIAQPPGDANVMLASSWDGLYRSEDGGAHWSRSDHGIAGMGIHALVASGSKIYATPGSRELVSTTGAGPWTHTLVSTNEYVLSIAALAVDPTNPDLVLAGSWFSGMYRSEDGGAHWTPLGTALAGDSIGARVQAIAFDPKDPQVVYATYSLFGGPVSLIRSVDRGASFQIMSMDLPPQISIGALLVHRHKPQHVFAIGDAGSAAYGLFRSVDGGTHWTRVIAGNISSVVADPVIQDRMYALAQAQSVLVSDDAGATWTALTTINQAVDNQLHSIEIDPKQSGVVYVVGSNWSLRSHYVMRTVDAGQTWEKIAGVAAVGWVPRKIVIAPEQPAVLYVSADGRSIHSFEIAPDLVATIEGHSGSKTLNAANELRARVQNTGLAATGVAFTITLPASLQSVSASVPNGQCSVQAGTVRCSVPFVHGGEAITATVTYTPTVAGTIDVTASVSARERDPQMANNIATATATATAAAAPTGGNGGGGGGGGGSSSMLLILLLGPLQALRIHRRRRLHFSHR